MCHQLSEEQLQKLREVPPEEYQSALSHLREANPTNKYECICCDSSDAFHLNLTRTTTTNNKPKPAAKCFSCGEAFNSIDLIQELKNFSFMQAVRFLIRQASTLDDDMLDNHESHLPESEVATINKGKTEERYTEGGKTSNHNAPVQNDLQGVLEQESKLINWRTQQNLAYQTLQTIYRSLALDDDGADYLQTRGLDTSLCEEYLGVRSVGRNDWREILDSVPSGYLRSAGIKTYFLRPDWNIPDDRSTLNHALIFPYFRHNRSIKTLRVREAAKDCHARSLAAPNESRPVSDQYPPSNSVVSKIQDSSPHSATLPFLANRAVRTAHCLSTPLYIVEGEIDALSVWSSGRPAMATFSASIWRRQWMSQWCRVPDIVIFADGDEAGRKLAKNIIRTARDDGEDFGIGITWIESNLHVSLPEDGDANDLLQEGMLGQYLNEVEQQI